MPFDFPQNPAVDDEHSQYGITYVWSGFVWNVKPAPAAIPEPPPDDELYGRTTALATSISTWQLVPDTAVEISDTPPLTPSVGQLWYESDTAKLYLWYMDVDSVQWLQVNGGGGGGGGGGTAGPPGPAGVRGSKWYDGVGDPPDPFAADALPGDYYLDTSNGAVWEQT